MDKKMMLIVAAALLQGSIAPAQDHDDIDPSAVEEFAPVELAKGNDLFIGAYVDMRVNARLRGARSNPGSSASNLVTVKVPPSASGAVNVNICSLSTATPARQNLNVCNVSGVAVQGR